MNECEALSPEVRGRRHARGLSVSGVPVVVGILSVLGISGDVGVVLGVCFFSGAVSVLEHF